VRNGGHVHLNNETTMFVHDFTYVDLPASAVRAHVLGDHGSWLNPLAGGATADGEALRVRISPEGKLSALSKVANVELGQPFERGDVTVVPMTWHATGATSAFPVLHADLEIARLGSETTQLSLLGRYDPPLGAVGRHLDQLLLHRIAEASVRSFLRRLADALSAAVPAGPVAG
jgi:hypothetical protein